MTQNIERAILDSIESGKRTFIFGLSNKTNLNISEAFKKLSTKCEEVLCLLDPNNSDLPNFSVNEMMEHLSGIVVCDQDNYIAAFTKPNKYLIETCGMTLCYHDADSGSTIYSIDTLNNAESSFFELLVEPNEKLIG